MDNIKYFSIKDATNNITSKEKFLSLDIAIAACKCWLENTKATGQVIAHSDDYPPTIFWTKEDL